MVLIAIVTFTLLLLESCSAIRMRGGEGSFDEYVPVNGNISLLCDYDLEGDTLNTLFWYKNEKLLLKYHPKAPIIAAQAASTRRPPPPSANQLAPRNNISLLNNSHSLLQEPSDGSRNNSGSPDALPARPDPIRGVGGGALVSMNLYRTPDPNVMRMYPNPGALMSLGGPKNSTRRISGAEIVLSSVRPEGAGNYTCEATTEGPVFQTVRKSFNLLVVVPPTSDPFLSGASGRVKADQEVKATCHAPPAYPAPTVKFYINGQPVVKGFMSRPLHRNRNNRILVSRSVTFTAYKQLFTNGHLQLECKVSLLKDHWKATKELILEAHVVEHLKGGGSSSICKRKRLIIIITASVLMSLGVIILLC